MCRGASHGRHCCGLGTKKSVIFSAFYSVFTAVMCMSMMLLRFTTKVDVEIHADISVLSYGSLAVYSIHIIVSFVLLAGANLDRRGAFFPWFAWTCLVMAYEGLAVLLYFSASKHKQKGFRRWDIFCSFFYAFRTAINVFCIICVLCRYRLIRIPDETPCTYVFPSPEHCERRPRLQKHLITIMESALGSSTSDLSHQSNSVILMTSLPPPYDTDPPPYGDLVHNGRCLNNPTGGATRVLLECHRDMTRNECECKKLPNDAEDADPTEDSAFLAEQTVCQCNTTDTTADNNDHHDDIRLRPQSRAWRENDVEDVMREEDNCDAVIYMNPMVGETGCATLNLQDS